MTVFHSSPEPFQAVREEHRILVENRYIRCVHDLDHGGGLSEVIIRNGSGNNLLAAPQSTIAAILENGTWHCYKSGNGCATQAFLSTSNGNPVLETRGFLVDDSGTPLDGLEILQRVEYTHWGEGLFRVTLLAKRRIENLCMLQIGTLWPTKRMNCLAVQEPQINAQYAYAANNVKNWIPLHSGKSRNDIGAFVARWLPVSMLVFQRGVEGIQFNLGDDLSQWDNIPGALPGCQLGYFTWVREQDCYEMRFSTLDCLKSGQYLDGEHVFEFSLAFPFVRERVVPFSPCAGNILFSSRGLERRWPTEADLQHLKEAGTTLMRLHNDGNSLNNGIFWRDAAYPPYPPSEMAKMDDLLRRAHQHGISVVPYFSLHEYHPEAAGFEEHAEEWGRIAVEGAGIIANYGPNGYFGYQMCLHSDWFQKRRETIEEVLSKHAFDGMYYDWCVGLECLNSKHGPRHRDFRKLLKLLEWSHTRAGSEGALYLHLTHNPNFAAENMASLVLTEESGFASISPEMFTPHAHFMNVAPRQVCDMLPPGTCSEDQRRFAMCALLNHATVSSASNVYFDFYRKYAALLQECSSYARHTAPGEGSVYSSNPNIGLSAYWTDQQNMLLFANLSGIEETAEYAFSPDGRDIAQGKIHVPPLSLKILKNAAP